MNAESLSSLEYGTVRQQLESHAISYAGKKYVQELMPMTGLQAIRRAMEETEEAKLLLEKGSSVPIASMEGMEWTLSLLGTGYLFNEQDLAAVALFLGSCGQLRKYMLSKQQQAPRISSYASSMLELAHVKEEIERCIRFGRVEDQASKGLEKVRKRLSTAKERLQRKLEALMSRHQSILQENMFSQRGGRYVIPVKREYHKQIKGAVVDQSASGQTLFMEPYEISLLQGELDLLKAEEVREETIVLSDLASLVEREQAAIRLNIEVTAIYDFIFAKAKYARTMDARAVKWNEHGKMQMIGARHPMLPGMVPISLTIGSGGRSLIITGPNTGGKTVVLKTLGLMVAMAQSGLLVPVEEVSEFTVFNNMISVIGDGQSLSQSLSTFSAQMKRIEIMLEQASKGVLLLIDELAAGTDPGEGIALSIAILEALSAKGANLLVTTHFNELKAFAAVTEGFQNARMEFDQETLQPLYRLTVGEAGDSYALQIAEKLGIAGGVIERSRQIVEQQQRRLQQGGRSWSELILEEGQPKQTGALAAQPHAQPDAAPKTAAPAVHYEIGDAVRVTSLGQTGIVYEKADKFGRVGVMIQKQKLTINHKRLKPYLSKEELYPENYDFDIIFESKDTRKKRKLMQRKHVEGLTIIHKADDNN
ncbi:endonuclease MutS2 [Paenibacillus donghaensis]|uniref:DNA mismatch repair protein MutS n=1 Tax=Paenibacillus donghaensis TaxID=414771 RepID=A0A2Z2KGK1_9BACL|nr:DNA mismatch repair protein MutS [Paenibacillus donghaensis]ASA24977.1 DNA mismatch repair protein MutS [Paenibacillus donghaensis]